MRPADVQVPPRAILEELDLPSFAAFLRAVYAGELEPEAVAVAAGVVRDRALRGELEHGGVVESRVALPRVDPVVAAFERCDLERDLEIAKGEVAELVRCGVADVWRKSFERRQDDYIAELGLAWNAAHWAAINDLCSATGDLGRYGRRIRALRVRACQHNAAILGRSVPRAGGRT